MGRGDRARGSLMKVGLKRKLMVSFSLMSITPLLVFCVLLFYYVQPSASSLAIISIVLLLVVLLALLGFHLMKDVIMKVIRLAIAVEKLSTRLELSDVDVTSEDEIGVLEAAINRLIRRLEQGARENGLSVPPASGNGGSRGGRNG